MNYKTETQSVTKSRVPYCSMFVSQSSECMHSCDDHVPDDCDHVLYQIVYCTRLMMTTYHIPNDDHVRTYQMT